MDQSPATNELVLPAHTYSYVLDKTNGNIVVHVGPIKESIGGNDQPIMWDNDTKAFVEVSRPIIQNYPTAPSGWYMIVKNPAIDGEQPVAGKSVPSKSSILEIGKKINIPGPMSFPAWPGQMVDVVPGHLMESNEYLVCQVYDAIKANEYLAEAVDNNETPQPVPHMADAADEVPADKPKAKATASKAKVTKSKKQEHVPYIRGQRFIIKGSDVPFYIPPTGFEVLPMKNGEYIRQAVTLEAMEYAILLNNQGDKEFIKGPDTVFPTPHSDFIKAPTGEYKHTAIELDNSGIHVKNTKTGKDEFITDKDASIYFPKTEHALITHSDGQKIHFAIAVPETEGRYVLDKTSGEVSTIEGPKMLLPDPRHQVIVKRVLHDKQAQLWYPASDLALQFNRDLRATSLGESVVWDSSDDLMVGASLNRGLDSSMSGDAQYMSHISMRKSASAEALMDSINRPSEYSPPKTITIDNKFDGVPSISIWTGYAIRVKGDGEPKTVKGPNKYLMGYTEDLEVITLSTGERKSKDEAFETVYLKHMNNAITDTMIVETSDLCKFTLTLSYKVDFTGDENKWFDIDNYVQYLCDRMRSIISSHIRTIGVSEFYSGSYTILRDTILGKSEDGSRAGKLFTENNMKITDIEVISVRMNDANIEQRLRTVASKVVETLITTELCNTEIEQAKVVSSKDLSILTENTASSITRNKKTQELNLSVYDMKLDDINSQLELIKDEHELAVEAIDNKRILFDKNQEIAVIEADFQHNLAMQRNEVQSDLAMKLATAKVKEAESVSDKLITAIQTHGNIEQGVKMAEHLGLNSILGSKSLTEIVEKVFSGTGLMDKFNLDKDQF